MTQQLDHGHHRIPRRSRCSAPARRRPASHRHIRGRVRTVTFNPKQAVIAAREMLSAGGLTSLMRPTSAVVYRPLGQRNDRYRAVATDHQRCIRRHRSTDRIAERLQSGTVHQQAVGIDAQITPCACRPRDHRVRAPRSTCSLHADVEIAARLDERAVACRRSRSSSSSHTRAMHAGPATARVLERAQVGAKSRRARVREVVVVHASAREGFLRAGHRDVEKRST